MGQQQLILLVLATVIVGIAIVVGITAFSENSAKSNADAMMQDAVRIGNDIQAWGQKPLQFGGPDPDSEDFTDATFAAMGYETDGGDYVNLNGTYSLGAITGGVLITGQSFDDDNVVKNEVKVAVCGTDSEDDVIGAVTQIRGVAADGDPDCGGSDTTT